jgi:hypothetical protein
MATFGELKTEIAAKLTDGDLQYPTTSQIGDTINSIIKRYDNKHFWFSEADEEITLNVNDPIVPDIPEDFKNEVNPGGLVIVYNQLRYPLAKIKPDIYDTYNVEGQGLPYCYTYRNGLYLLYFYPDQAYTLFLNYRKSYALLVGDDDENDFTIYTDRMIVYACLAEIYATYKRDPDMAVFYKGLAKEEFEEVMSETYERTASGSLTPDNAYSNGQFYNYWR